MTNKIHMPAYLDGKKVGRVSSVSYNYQLGLNIKGSIMLPEYYGGFVKPKIDAIHIIDNISDSSFWIKDIHIYGDFNGSLYFTGVLEDKTTNIQTVSRCECGAEACGISTHSSWCPMYNE